MDSGARSEILRTLDALDYEEPFFSFMLSTSMELNTITTPQSPALFRSTSSNNALEVASYNTPPATIEPRNWFPEWTPPPPSPSKDEYQDFDDGVQCAASSSAAVMAPTGNVLSASPKMIKFIMPSGPRMSGEGIEDEDQGIVDVVIVTANILLVQMTLLVAGFILGPSGESVRSIITRTGSTIYSYTERLSGRKSRIFYLAGNCYQLLHAMDIITAAVRKYKDLAEGGYNGYQVEKRQRVEGVDFFYQPPPRSAVPYAASLKMHKSSKGKSHRKASSGSYSKKHNSPFQYHT